MLTSTKTLLSSALLVAALTLAGCGGASSSKDEQAADAASSSTASPTTTLNIQDTGGAMAKCALPTAELLATQDTAFEGTVTELKDGTAVLSVERWFTGEESQQVEVLAPGEDMDKLIGAVKFEVGKTYLVAATGGNVMACGFSAEKDATLEQMYVDAFGS